MKKPLVTVIIPAYNYADKLARAVISVRNQNIENIEIIIINDCSTDNTDEVARSLLTDDTVYIINEVNLGLSKSINLGFQNASGEFVCLLDADDELPQDSLRLRLEAFKDKDHLDAVHGGITLHGAKKDEYIPPLNTTMLATIINFLENGSSKYGINNITFMYHKRVFATIGYFDETDKFFPHDDSEFALRTLLKMRVGIIDEQLYLYKKHPDSHSDIHGTNHHAADNQQALKNKYIELFKAKSRINVKV